MKFEIAKVPNKISPCPITEAVVEMRFESKLPQEVLPGLTFSALQETFPKLEALPIMQLPQAIRDNDPNLKFSPQYRLSNAEFIFQIGPRCFSVVCPKEYKGWTKFSAQIETVFDTIKALNIIDKPIRIGLRYISFFENQDIFPDLKIALNLAGNSLIGAQNIVRSEFEFEGFKCVTQMANNALLNNKAKGSTIDIDIITDNGTAILTDFKAMVARAHEIEKKIFFSILKPELLTKLNPEY